MRTGTLMQTAHGLGTVKGTRRFPNGAEYWIVDVPYRPGYPMRVFISKGQSYALHLK